MTRLAVLAATFIRFAWEEVDAPSSYPLTWGRAIPTQKYPLLHSTVPSQEEHTYLQPFKQMFDSGGRRKGDQSKNLN